MFSAEAVPQKPRTVIITDSVNPVIFVAFRQETEEQISFNVEVNKIEAGALVDTCAAGDSFVGGFLAHMCLTSQDDVFEIG